MPVLEAVSASAGNEVIRLTPEETARFKTVGDEVAKAWVARMVERGIDGEALIAEARALVAKYAAQP